MGRGGFGFWGRFTAPVSMEYFRVFEKNRRPEMNFCSASGHGIGKQSTGLYLKRMNRSLSISSIQTAPIGAIFELRSDLPAIAYNHWKTSVSQMSPIFLKVSVVE